MKYEGPNVLVIGGRPHDIRCPQSGRSDVDDCCKPMVAFTATNDERERCAALVRDRWIAGTSQMDVCTLEALIEAIRKP